MTKQMTPSASEQVCRLAVAPLPGGAGEWKTQEKSAGAGSSSNLSQIPLLPGKRGSQAFAKKQTVSQERITMGNTALNLFGEGFQAQGADKTRGGRVSAFLLSVALLVMLCGGARTAMAQSTSRGTLPPPSTSSYAPRNSSSTFIPPPVSTPILHQAPVNAPVSQTRPLATQIAPDSPQGDPQAAPMQNGQPPVLPPPSVLPTAQPPYRPFDLGKGGPHCPPGQDGVFGNAPRPSKETLKQYKQYVDNLIDPEATLNLMVGRTRLMVMKRAPKRIQIADDTIAGYTVVEPTQLSLIGKQVGVTVLTLWFADPKKPGKETILSYHVRVFPDSERRFRLQQVYDALSKEINCLFPDSNVCVKLVGDKIAVTGFAHDIDQATKIIQIVRANAPDPRDPRPLAARIPTDRIESGKKSGELLPAGNETPGLDQYETAGGPYVINLLKVTGEQQVMLRVQVAEVNRAAARSIGLNFTLLNDQGIAYFANNTGAIATAGRAPTFNGGNGLGAGLGLLNFAGNTFGIPPLAGFPAGVGGFNNLPAALDNGQIRLAISALRNLNYARSLAEPTLTALNGETATFRAGGQFPVPVVTGFTSGGLQGVNFVPFGVQLTFTPFVTDRDRVRLVMAAEVSSRDLQAGNTFIGGAAIPSLNTRNFQTTVELREGQTLAVAGLIQNNLGAEAQRIPFIGDLPVLSRLLGFDRLTAGEQELVILVTPELVHPMEHHEVPALPGADLFEPTDLEFYLMGRLESHYPIDYRSPVRNDASRIYHFQQMESLYLYGPSGHVSGH